MSKDLSKISLYAIVNYTAQAGDEGGITIPVNGIVNANLTKYLMLWKCLIPEGVGANTLGAAPALANNGISFTTTADTDLSTYQFVIYQQE